MEKFRLKQAETLLRDAGKSKSSKEILKTPNEGFINIDVFERILNNLIEAEEFIYSSKPFNKLDQAEAQLFIGKMLVVRDDLDSILSDFDVIEKKNLEEDVKEYSKNVLILTTKSNFKKAIVKLGVDPQMVVVAGVPLNIEDMKILNPKIPDTALKPIETKIEHVKNDIKRKMEQFNLDNIIVLVEKDKPGEILGKRAEEIYNAKVIRRDDIKDISVGEFISILS